MRSGALDQEPGRGSARLVPQSDGYAEYVGQAREQVRPTGPGQHRSSARRPPGQDPTRNIPTGSLRIKGEQPPRRRQRSIRSAITWLLILPVLTIIGLYIYAAYGTIGPAIARQESAAVSTDVGQPATVVAVALQTEQADTFIYQASGHRAMPDGKLTAPGTGDYAKTDAAIAALQAGAAKSQGNLSAPAKQATAALISSLNTRLKLRGEVQSGSLDGLTVFKGYLAISQSFLGSFASVSNPNATAQMYYQGEGTLDAAIATDDLAQVGTLLGGVIAGGGYMTPQEYQLFEQLYYAQQQYFTIINQPVYWQVSPDPYWTSVNGQPAAMSTPQVRAALNLEQEVLAAGSNRATVRLPITPTQMQVIGGVLAPSSPLLTAKNVAQAAVNDIENRQGTQIEERVAEVGGAGLLLVILSTFLLLRFGARISRELTGLRNAAQVLSGERLPSVVRRLRAGDDVDVTAEAPPLALKTRTREVTDTAYAFSVVQHTAIDAAVEQAMLRKGVSNVFRSLARRNQSLVQRQLRMLDEMERGTQDPDALAQLFRLDHLTTRMRRQAEGLIILSGSAPGRRWRHAVPVVEVLRGAISEIEDYVRVDLLIESTDYLTGAAVADVTHLLAELIENAVVYSPPGTRVQVHGGRVANGYVVEIDDRGLGIPPAARDKLNERLAQPVEFDLADSDQLGLFVVSRLAVRNGIKVSLRESDFGGTTAIALLPAALVVSEQEAAALSAQGAQGAIPTGGREADEAGPAESTITTRRAPRFDRPAGVQDDQQDSRSDRSFGDRPSFGGQSYANSGSYSSPPVFSGGSSFGSGQPAGSGSLGGGSFNGGSPGGGSGSGAPPPARGGGRGAFGDPAPFQDAPKPSRAASSHAAPAPTTQSPFTMAGDGGGQSVGVAGSGLPKREKMASLAPQLRDNRPETPKGPLPGRSPEQARALLSSIQRGLRTGREADTATGAFGNDAEDGTTNGDGAGNGTDGRGMR